MTDFNIENGSRTVFAKGNVRHEVTWNEHAQLGWSWYCSCGHGWVALGQRATREEASASAIGHLDGYPERAA